MEKNNQDLKEKLLSNEEQKFSKEENSKEPELHRKSEEKPKEVINDKEIKEDKKDKTNPRGIWFTAKFIFVALWQGGLWIKFQVILTLIMIVLAKILNVFHPLVLKILIDTLIEGNSIYHLVAFYTVAKLAADGVNNLREMAFSRVSANAEVIISSKIFNHIQNQSLAFHLNRETGKIIRICSRGSQSFSQVLRMLVFSLGPLMLEIALILVIILIFYNIWFFCLVLASIIFYILDTIFLSEWRVNVISKMNQKDSNSVAKATDSLLNFETGQYFDIYARYINNLLFIYEYKI